MLETVKIAKNVRKFILSIYDAYKIHFQSYAIMVKLI